MTGRAFLNAWCACSTPCEVIRALELPFGAGVCKLLRWMVDARMDARSAQQVLWVGIDLGATNAKAAVVTLAGRKRAF